MLYIVDCRLNSKDKITLKLISKIYLGNQKERLAKKISTVSKNSTAHFQIALTTVATEQTRKSMQ
jgi:hypothetical protein